MPAVVGLPLSLLTFCCYRCDDFWCKAFSFWNCKLRSLLFVGAFTAPSSSVALILLERLVPARPPPVPPLSFEETPMTPTVSLFRVFVAAPREYSSPVRFWWVWAAVPLTTLLRLGWPARLDEWMAGLKLRLGCELLVVYCM